MISNNKTKSQKSIIIMILIILLIVAAFFTIQSGAFERAIDPCEKELSDCNHSCGEGILSSICKEKCTYDYGVCKNE
jgi:uncharacterized ion transporter superfamily protein YfcC